MICGRGHWNDAVSVVIVVLLDGRIRTIKLTKVINLQLVNAWRIACRMRGAMRSAMLLTYPFLT